MNKAMPSDDEARGRAMTDLDSHIFLSAGAGTGKTHVLVERYLEFLRTARAAVLEIVCVTFTEKAAGELKDRIRRACEKEALSGPAQAATWQRHKRDLENAPINTIHGFCARLLRENALLAGVDPKFQVMDERETGQLREEVSRDFVLKRLRSDSSPDMLLLVGGMGIPSVLELFCQALVERVRASGEPADLNGERAFERWRKFHEQCLNDELGKLQAEPDWQSAVQRFAAVACLDSSSKFAAQRITILDALAVLFDPKQPLSERVRCAQEVVAVRVPAPSARQWADPEALKTAFAAIKDTLKQLRVPVHVPEDVERTALEFSLAFYRECRLLRDTFQTAKRPASRLDFDDLQLETLRLLREEPSVSQRAHKEFKAFLIDEFQDTDDIQKEILWRLAGHFPGDGGGPVANLFVVGDAKQSIYRFRGADVTVFNRTEREFLGQPDRAKLGLSRNFRTQDSLLGFLNELFLSDAVMGQNVRDTLYHARYEPLVAERPSDSQRPCVDLLLASDSEDEVLSAEALRVREAGLIAEHIAQLVRDQPFQVEEKDENGENVRKPLSWKHFAMLFRAMSDVPIYEWALRRWDVPFYVVAGRGFYARQEVRDLLNFLKAVENRRDEVALVGVLRSPFFGVSDRAIYWLCQGRSVSANMAVLAGRLRREKGLGPLAEIEDLELRKLRRADDAICHFRRIKDRLRLGALMEAIVAETGFSSALLAGPGGDQKVSNLRKVAELARSLEHSAALSVDDFIRIVEDLVVREDREGEAPTREEESDVVKLLTVHKAKGLEWPVVIVPDCSRRPRLRSNEAFLASTEMGTVLKGEDASGASGWPAVGRLLAAEEEKKELAEHRRLFYVAATRARDHLVLSGSLRSDSTKAQNTWLSWLMEALNLDRGLAGGPTKEQEARGCTVRVRSFDPLGEDAATSERVATGGGGAVPPRPIPSLDAIRARIRVFRPDTSRRRRFTVTELEEYDACPHKFYLKRVRDLAEYHWTVPGALRLGLPESGSAQRREHASQEGALGGMELDLSPAERGTIAHRAVQRLLTIRNLPLEVLVKDCLREARIALPTHSRAFEDTCGILRRSQGTELWQRLAAAQRLEVEAPFSFRVATGLAPQTAGVAVEGALDVVASEETGQSLLADFKTGSARPDAYSFQIGLYCLALEATRGQAPGTAALYYLDRGATELLNVADLLAESKQQLVQAVRGILQSEFDRKAQVGCSGCGLFWACDQRIEAQNRRPDPANTRTG